MCLAVPAQIESVSGPTAVCRMSGVTKEVDVSLIPDAAPGDWVIVHVGFALQRIDAEKARETLAAMAAFTDSTAFGAFRAFRGESDERGSAPEVA